MSLLVYYGDPVLRKRATEIEEIDDEVRTLVENLHKARKEYNGHGVAAPQVGESRRVFVAGLDSWGPDGRCVYGETKVFINPEISAPSKEMQAMDDGCLSLPGIRVPIERPMRITVEALDLDGKPFKLELEGLSAWIIMHENDHLNGVLIIDRTSKKERARVEPALKMIKKRLKCR